MDDFKKTLLKSLGFEKEVKRCEHGLCVFCAKIIERVEFRDGFSWKEFLISGLCQSCQDEIFE